MFYIYICACYVYDIKNATVVFIFRRNSRCKIYLSWTLYTSTTSTVYNVAELNPVDFELCCPTRPQFHTWKENKNICNPCFRATWNHKIILVFTLKKIIRILFFSVRIRIRIQNGTAVLVTGVWLCFFLLLKMESFVRDKNCDLPTIHHPDIRRIYFIHICTVAHSNLFVMY